MLGYVIAAWMSDRNLPIRDVHEQHEMLSSHVGCQDFAMSAHSDDCSVIKVGDGFPRMYDSLQWVT